MARVVWSELGESRMRWREVGSRRGCRGVAMMLEESRGVAGALLEEEGHGVAARSEEEEVACSGRPDHGGS